MVVVVEQIVLFLINLLVVLPQIVLSILVVEVMVSLSTYRQLVVAGQLGLKLHELLMDVYGIILYGKEEVIFLRYSLME